MFFFLKYCPANLVDLVALFNFACPPLPPLFFKLAVILLQCNRLRIELL